MFVCLFAWRKKLPFYLHCPFKKNVYNNSARRALSQIWTHRAPFPHVFLLPEVKQSGEVEEEKEEEEEEEERPFSFGEKAKTVCFKQKILSSTLISRPCYEPPQWSSF